VEYKCLPCTLSKNIHPVISILRNVARKFSIGGLCVSAGGLDTLKIDKNSTALKCFVSQFGGLRALFGGLSPQKFPRGDGTEYTVYGKKSFLSKESDTKIFQSIHFAYEVGIISSYSNRIIMNNA